MDITMIHHIFYILLNITGIVINLIAIYIVCSKREIRTIPNIFVVNCIICEIIYLICNIGLHVIVTTGTMIISYTTAVLASLQLSALVAMIWFIFIIVMDWIFATFIKKASEAFRRVYIILIAVVWLIATIGCILQYVLDEDIGYMYYHIVCYYIVCIFTAICQSYRLILVLNRKLQYSIGMSDLAGVWLLMYLPGRILYTILVVNPDTKSFQFASLARSAEYSAGLHPIANLLLLFFICPEFQRHFRNTFKCQNSRQAGGVISYHNPNVNQNQQFLTQSQQFPNQNQQFSSQNQQFPNQNQPFLSQNQQFPNQNQQFSSQNQQFPNQNLQFPNQNQQFTNQKE